jgi:hypothetical protein
VARKGHRLLLVGSLVGVCRQRRCRKAFAAWRLAHHSIPVRDSSDIDGQVLMLPYIDCIDVRGLSPRQGTAKVLQEFCKSSGTGCLCERPARRYRWLEAQPPPGCL